MMGLVVAVILAIIFIGVILKVIKFAVILALCVGAYLLVQNKFGAKRLK